MPDPYDPYGTYGPQLPSGGDGGGGFSVIPLPLQASGNIPSQSSVPQMTDPMKLIQALNQKADLIQKQAQPIMGQYIPRQIQQGPTPPWANPNTKAGQKANLGAALGQAIGGAVTQYAERKEMQKAQNIAMDMQRLSDAITNPTPENKAMAEEILNDDKRRSEIAKVMNIQFMGDDKRKPYQKLANQIFHKRQADQQRQQDLQQQQQRLQQNLAQQQTPYFDQLARKMPTMPGLSPETQIQFEMIKAGYLPSAGQRLEFFSRMTTNDVNWQRTLAQVGATNARTLMLGAIEDARLRGIQLSDETKVAIANARDATSIYTAGLRLRGELARAGATVESAGIHAQALRDVTGMKTKSAEEIQKEKSDIEKQKLEQKNLKLSLDTQVKNYQTQLNVKNRELSDATKSIDKLQGQVPSKAQQDALNNAKTRQYQLQNEINELTNSMQNVSNFSKYMEKQEQQPTTGPQYGPTTPPTGAPSQPTGAPPAPTVPTAPTAQDILFNSIFKNASSDFGEDDEP